MASILANMGKYGQPLSPSNLHAVEKTQEKDAPEELHAKEAEVENLSVHNEKISENAEQE